MPPPQYDAEVRKRLRELYEHGGDDGEGMTVREIAEQVGLSHQRVHIIVSESGAKMRPPGPRPGRGRR